MTLKIIGGTPIVTDKQMRDRDPDDFYETDPRCIEVYLRENPIRHPFECVLDPGAGTGSYGNVLRNLYPYIELWGVEKNSNRFPPTNNNYNTWSACDFIETRNLWNAFDVVMGNPPYKLAEEFFWQSLRCLRDGTGTIDFLLRLGFLESGSRYNTMYSVGYKPTQVTVLNTRPSFTGDGKTYPAAFAFFRWEFEDGVCKENSRLQFLAYKRKMLENSSTSLIDKGHPHVL